MANYDCCLFVHPPFLASTCFHLDLLQKCEAHLMGLSEGLCPCCGSQEGGVPWMQRGVVLRFWTHPVWGVFSDQVCPVGILKSHEIWVSFNKTFRAVMRIDIDIDIDIHRSSYLGCLDIEPHMDLIRYIVLLRYYLIQGADDYQALLFWRESRQLQVLMHDSRASKFVMKSIQTTHLWCSMVMMFQRASQNFDSV